MTDQPASPCSSPPDGPAAIRVAGDLCCESRHVEADTRNKDVFALFESDPSLLNLPVVADGGEIVGLINREAFMRSMAHRYHWELYSTKRCTKMMADSPVVVEAETPILELAALLQDRGEAGVLADGFAIVREGRLIGTGRTSDVLTAIVQQERKASEELRRHRDRLSDTVDQLVRANAELKELNRKLDQAQRQLIQSEKMASIGILAAGMAHEINNPIGFVHSDIGSLEVYLADIFRVLDAYQAAEPALSPDPDAVSKIAQIKREVDLAYLRADSKALLDEARDGVGRVRKIVQDLKDFSHADGPEAWGRADLHQGLDSTLSIVSSAIKHKADVVKDYGELPVIECLPSQLNQVFMNLLANAAGAIDGEERGTVTLRTRCDGDEVRVEISDTGCGIAPENLPRIFDPFFTTKPVGKGTGLGLSVSYGIVEKHHGSIEAVSEVGKGTTFTVRLPVKQPPDA